MDKIHNKSLVPLAKELRKNMTKAERHLWYDFLKDYPIPMVRQKVIGRYIVDFYCPAAKIAIELDGEQHHHTNDPEYDVIRTDYLNQYDIEVIRFKNSALQNDFTHVCECIHFEVKRRLIERSDPRVKELL